MLDQIRAFLSSLGGGDDTSSSHDASEPDVAAVALFYHVIGADGVVDEVEAQTLRDMISEEYAGSAKSAEALLKAGEEADRESVDLYAFTSVLNRSLGPESKTHFIELLWRLAYADGHRHELEDHVVWRISDLMGVSSRDRVLARQRALKDAGIEDESGDGDS
ncbi:MAG: TerB family tellurite resistance protein [Hoeflea sp.]|uniref:tellurite resistance TerB family protein n=1 Tax=Hoeflea sp. TaxID=1940281 RepID=UPI0032EC37B3